MRRLLWIPLLCSLAFGQGATVLPKTTILPKTTVFPGTAASGITVTGKTCVGQNTFSNPTCTWSVNPSVGENIVCAVGNFNDGGDTPFSVTDNASTPNTYTADGSNYLDNTNTTGNYQLFTSFSITHSPSTSTFSVTGATQNQPIIDCITYTGGTGAVDGTPGHATVGSGSTSVTATINPTGSADLAFGLGSITGNFTFTAGSSFTLIGGIVGSSSSFKSEAEYQVLSSSGSQNCPITYSSSTPAAAILCGTFK